MVHSQPKKPNMCTNVVLSLVSLTYKTDNHYTCRHQNKCKERKKKCMQRVNRIFRQSCVKDQLQTITSNSSHKSPLSPQPPTPAMHISAFHPIFSLFHSLTNQPRTSLEGNDIMNFMLKIGALGKSSCYSSTARPSSQIFSPSSATFSPFQGPHNLGISPPLVLPFVIPL